MSTLFFSTGRNQGNSPLYGQILLIPELASGASHNPRSRHKNPGTTNSDSKSKENAGPENQGGAAQEKTVQTKTKLRDKWSIIKRKLRQRKFDEYLRNGRLKPFLETFQDPKNEQKSREIVKDLILSKLWKLELEGLLEMLPFREAVRFDPHLQIVSHLQINNCDYSHFEQVNKLFTFLEQYLKSKNKRTLEQMCDMVREPPAELVETLTRRFEDPQFNFNSATRLQTREWLVKLFVKLTLENYSRRVPRSMERLLSFVKAATADNTNRFWGSIKFDFQKKRVSVEITEQNRNYELLAHFAQLARVGFGLALKTVSFETGESAL